MSLRQHTSAGWCFHLALVTLAASVGWGQAEIFETPELDAGFRLLYELRPEEARAKFAAWQASHPQDALGVAAQAASYLFEECYRQGVLTSAYFLDDKLFLGKIALVMTLSLGMQADYASLIDKHQIESLAMIRAADNFAKRLLVVNPDASDAYLTLGAANYIIGSLPAFKRFFLKFKGISGDKKGGIEQLEIAAARGRYLRPFAKIILAMVSLREKNLALARTQLEELVAEFPQNPLFAAELAKLDAPSDARASR
ncbi:MAG: hypothetical protein LAP61_07780 [Acidobacteriia bacterium]|nr:hypothetical protein [Terriglobia bacterium]